MSGKTPTPVVYWDSSAFLALLKEERTHGAGVYEALVTQATSFDHDKIILASSSLTILEVLSADLSDDVRDRFEKMIRRSNFQPITASENVMRHAARLRQHCYGRHKNGNGDNYLLSSPDAIHVVSAMLIKADVLVTLDSANKSKTREMAMTIIPTHYPVPDLHSVRIERPALGLPGTSMI